MSTPATRSLAAVLRGLTDTETPCRLLVGTYAAPGADPTYANVTIAGTTLQIPKLAGTAGQEGQPAYILASPGRMLVLGTVSN